MKVAIVAVGALARYMAKELLAEGHNVVTVSRSRRDWLEELVITQLVTDYSTKSLAALLDDCDAAICTLVGGIPEYVSIHKAILAARTASTRCKHFILSVWAGNLQDLPEEQLGGSDELTLVLDALRGRAK